ncbi:ATP-dependent RecD-like DNA helicase [Botrimarina colliarenosi]|uniref:ATP-dependent RecD-like DNA helicase n=1 Tax=Botrimarina colliarenosi TaxID=2528001 RepID=A0A5C5ZZM5_9BACT|nr:TM0106 family RecB-like putative nuclease [Botrimarina colliarenosi]TWT91793.1 ATP-dependent RecD-like DNA helicase [Botrimarina colliarenosi]
MERRTTGLMLSATDLANHLACRHLTQLERGVAEGESKRPFRSNDRLETLRTLGNEHEQKYVEHLRIEGKSVLEVASSSELSPNEQTLAAMQSGVDVIIQAPLEAPPWRGRSDLLIRVESPSDLGPWSYEVADTKLSNETRGGTALQLCLYSDLVGVLQGKPPLQTHVVKPGDPFAIETLWLDHYWAYYRRVRQRLIDDVGASPAPLTYPDPVAFCDVCQWSGECRRRRCDDDHLSLVAGVTKLHIVELTERAITTLEAFAEEPNLDAKPLKRGSLDSLRVAQDQAKIQLKGRKSGSPEIEFLRTEAGLGLNRLPEPAAGDVFFDLEGERLSPDGGMEYLFGYAYENGDVAMESRWSMNASDEKAAFEGFMDFVGERWAKCPGMHVYHYAPYEEIALKRLATKYATRERELDRMLRSGRLIDLHAVVRQSLRASVERYSIKDLEAFYGFGRATELPIANRALARVEAASALRLPDRITDEDRESIASYNRDDCLSTWALRDWLERLRDERLAAGETLVRPEDSAGDGSDEIQATDEELDRVAKRLTAGLPEDESGDRHPHRLLANLLPYYRREEKCVWWDYFHLQGLETEPLRQHQDAIAGLRFVGVVGDDRKQRFRYAPQETAIEVGDSLFEVGGGRIGTVDSIDRPRGELNIKKSAAATATRPQSVFRHNYIPAGILAESLLDFGKMVADATAPLKDARYELLCRNPPRLRSLELPLESNRYGETVYELVSDLDHSVLPIQGPPGTGKTHTTAEAIIRLVAEGKRVGVAAVGHKVILNVLAKVAELSDGKTKTAHFCSSKIDLPSGVRQLRKFPEVEKALVAETVVGGTAWLWSKPDWDENPLDVLFIDEAGQASLAMTISAGRAATNLVLVGDPQQLDQPQKGSHPEGADASALKHLLGGNATVSPERGLLLEETWRLHPEICQFTSELYYDGKLRSRSGLEAQVIEGDSPLSGSGLIYLPVPHEGNQNESIEEIEAVRRAYDLLLDGGHHWMQNAGWPSRRLGTDDILVVAPYNRQVNGLLRALPDGARVGTVDKFQGQEAPVVIYSMTTSSAHDAPRGMEFLYSPNRLNVATSRAQALVLLVGSPQLLEADCKSPEQMRLANGICRFVERAQSVML